MESLKKNYAFQLAYQILNMCLPFVTSPYISRVLGAEALGIYSYTYSISNIFVLFINLGIEKYGSRAIAVAKQDQNKMNKVFSELFLIKLIIGLAVTLIYIISVSMYFEYKVLFFIQTLLLIGSALDINWLFFGIEKFKVTVFRNFVFKIITVSSVFVFVKSIDDLWIYVLILSTGTILGQLSVWLVAHRYVSFAKVNFAAMLQHIRPLLILFIAILAQSAYTYIDKIMIGKLADMEQLGFCENAYKIISFPMGIITSIGTVMLPRMSALYRSDKQEKAQKYISLTMYFAMILACAMIAGIAAVGTDFSIIFWGRDFETSGRIVVVISPIIWFMTWSDIIRNQFLIPNGFDKKYTTAIIIGAIVNIISNAMLIPKLGAIGAAVGTVLSYFSISLYEITVTRKNLPYLLFIKRAIPFYIIAMIMYICVKLLRNWIGRVSIMGLLLQVALGILVYGTLSLAYLHKQHQEI